MRVAKKYLVEANLTVGLALPKAKGAAGGAGAEPLGRIIMNTKSTALDRACSLSLTVMLTSILSFAQGGPAAGQSPPSAKGAVIKGRAPVSKEILKVKLPRAHEFKLSNGLQVILLEDKKLPTFSMQMVILSGGMSDAPDAIGSAQFTSSLLREGTKTRSSKQLAEQIELAGGSLFSNSSLAGITSVVTASGLTDNLNQILELFA
jgi:hypothetical protein